MPQRRGWLQAARAVLVVVAVAGVVAGAWSQARGTAGALPWILVGVSALLLVLLAADFLAGRLRARGATTPAVVRPGRGNHPVTVLNEFLGVITAGLTIYSFIVAHSAHAAAPHRDPCAVNLVGPAHTAALSASDEGDAGVSISYVKFSLYSGTVSPGKAQLHSAMYGQLTGDIPAGHAIYVLDWPNPHTTSQGGVPGYPHYYPRGRIIPGAHNCWSLPSRDLGEPKTAGIGERIFFMLVPDRSVRVFEAQKKWADTRPPNAPNPGFSHKQAEKLGVQPLAYYDIDTNHYNYMPSLSGG